MNMFNNLLALIKCILDFILFFWFSMLFFNRGWKGQNHLMFPVLILLAGLVALFNPTGVRSTAFIIIGISSLVYAASELLNWFKFTRRRPKTPDASVKAVDDIEDAQIIE